MFTLNPLWINQRERPGLHREFQFCVKHMPGGIAQIYRNAHWFVRRLRKSNTGSKLEQCRATRYQPPGKMPHEEFSEPAKDYHTLLPERCYAP